MMPAAFWPPGLPLRNSVLLLLPLRGALPLVEGFSMVEHDEARW